MSSGFQIQKGMIQLQILSSSAETPVLSTSIHFTAVLNQKAVFSTTVVQNMTIASTLEKIMIFFTER